MSHEHNYKGKRKNATMLHCDCGRFKNVVSESNPAIVEVKSSHTPTPWKLGRGNRPGMIIDANGAAVTEVPVEIGPTIVRAVNAHKRLVGELQSLIAWISDDVELAERFERQLNNAKDALAQVEGK